jgi:hypothetical protein
MNDGFRVVSIIPTVQGQTSVKNASKISGSFGMPLMFDANRENRVHVVNVRFKKDHYVVVLKDPTDNSTFEVGWETWIALPEKERRDYK